MNEASRWRIETARRLVSVYAGQPGVRMVVAGGSAARDEADAWSDLDMSVHWDAVPQAWLDAPRLSSEGGTRFTWMRIPRVEPEGWLEQYFVGDLKVDIAHLPLAWFEGETRAIQEDLDCDPDRQSTLEGMHGGVCVLGEEAFGTVKARLDAYPDALAEAMVRNHLQFMPGWALAEQGLARDDLLLYYEVLLPVLRNVAGVLAGLNRRYVDVKKLKRIDRWLATLDFVPKGAAEHVDAVLRARDFAAHYDPLIEGVIALVEERMPAVDTAAARALLHFPMKPAFPT